MMSFMGIISMILIGGAVIGGFIYFLYLAIRAEK